MNTKELSGGWDKLEDWDWYAYTLRYKVDN